MKSLPLFLFFLLFSTFIFHLFTEMKSACDMMSISTCALWKKSSPTVSKLNASVIGKQTSYIEIRDASEMHPTR